MTSSLRHGAIMVQDDPVGNMTIVGLAWLVETTDPVLT
jgi:hypothetical protein